MERKYARDMYNPAISSIDPKKGQDIREHCSCCAIRKSGVSISDRRQRQDQDAASTSFLILLHMTSTLRRGGPGGSPKRDIVREATKFETEMRTRGGYLKIP